jgi:hypothetical protein
LTWNNGELELISKSTHTYAKAHGAGSTSSRGHTSRKEHIHGNLLAVQETGHGRPVKYMAFTEAAWEALWLRQLHQHREWEDTSAGEIQVWLGLVAGRPREVLGAGEFIVMGDLIAPRG